MDNFEVFKDLFIYVILLFGIGCLWWAIISK